MCIPVLRQQVVVKMCFVRRFGSKKNDGLVRVIKTSDLIINVTTNLRQNKIL
jgi:hypothetical protein